MNHLKLWLLMFLMAAMAGCVSTQAQKAEEKRDKQAAKVNVQLASGYLRRGDYEIAQTKLKKAIEFDDEYLPAYTTLAILMTMLNKPVEAENYYLEALDLDSTNPDLLNNYGTFLCSTGEYEEGVVQFNKSLRNQFYKTPEVAHANIGNCLLQNNKPNYKAIERHLRKALSKQPNMTTALFAMAELGLKTKKYLMARAYMQRYHALVKPDSISLWMQIQAEHALGDKKYFLKISRKLLDQFPNSPEAKELMELSNL